MKYITDIQKRREKKVADLRSYNKFSPSPNDRFDFDNTEHLDDSIKNKFLIKGVISTFLFILIYFIFQFNHPYALISQQYIKDALTRDFNFRGVYNLYQEQFSGNPAILPTFDIVNKGDIVPSFRSPISGLPLGIEKADTGIFIETGENKEVVAMDVGLVTKIGINEKLGTTIIIRHQNGVESTYSMLDKIVVEADDWVTVGQQIGTVNNKLYISIRNQEGYLNPLEVIVFD